MYMLASYKKELSGAGEERIGGRRALARKPQASSLSDSPLLPRTHAWRLGCRLCEGENAFSPHSPMLVDADCGDAGKARRTLEEGSLAQESGGLCRVTHLCMRFA